LKIESIEITDEAVAATQQNVPNLSLLASKLKTIHVKDPFLQEPGNPLTEDTIFGYTSIIFNN
jgi:hypothetical protein